jgi:signal transduction histidine kinase
MSLRLRLTLLYSAILALALAGFSAALYFTSARVMFAAIEETLANEAQRLTTSREFHLDQIGYRASRFSDPQTYIQTVWADGQVADRTANLGDFVLPLSDDGWQTCKKGRPWTETVSTETGRLLVHSKPVLDQGQVGGVLQVARSLVEYDQALNTLRGLLLSGSLLATLTTFGLGWGFAGAALHPINRITQTAQAIGAERDFDRRVSHSGPNDEVGRLTTTFNAMLTELQSAYQHLEQSLHSQRRFVADASHELRTPLTTIRGNLGLLEREPPIRAEDRVAVIADTVEECDRLTRLINNLLVLARADSGLTLRTEQIPIQPLIEDLCRQARLLASERTIRCENVLDAGLVGDRDALKQVLLILLDNAIKYTPPHGVITIATAAGEGRVAIHIRDTGPGIPPAALPHIFERFYRVDPARTSAGAGLGLAIAKELVEAQGGAISVESQWGKGSQFTLTLPQGGPEEDTPASSIGSSEPGGEP